MHSKRTPVLFCLALAALACTLVACGGDDDEPVTPVTQATQPTLTVVSAPEQSASDAAEELFGYFELGQHGRQWDLLHPAQQAVVTRDAYITCEDADASLTVSDSEAVEEFEETIDVPLVGSIPTTAVTMQFMVGDLEQHTTFHLIDVDGQWRWSLSPDEVAAYQAGDCPA